MSVVGLLLSDSRFPAGGHAYSGGVEPAVTAGTVTGLGTLETFLRGRLHTAGLVAAALAAAACAHARAGSQIAGYPQFPGTGSAPETADVAARRGSRDAASPTHAAPPGGGQHAGGGEGPADGGAREAGSGPASGQGNGTREGAAALVLDEYWAVLDAEADARTPAPAQREASRRQGRALLRAARAAWPGAAGLAGLAAGAQGPRAASAAGGASQGDGGPGAGHKAPRAEYRGGPHHAIALGAAAAAAGCGPLEAARIAAYQAVAGPASAAVRLLALDPMRATGVLAALAGDIDRVAGQAAGYAGGPPGDLPAASGPALDLLAQTHTRAEVRLFES